MLRLDVDGLARIDDTHGREVGDEVRRQVAQRLSATARRVDTAARYGRDAFVVVAENLAHPDDANLLAGRLARAVDGEHEVGGGLRVLVATTVGAAVAPDVVTGTAQPMVERTTALIVAAQEAMDGREAAARVVVPV